MRRRSRLTSVSVRSSVLVLFAVVHANAQSDTTNQWTLVEELRIGTVDGPDALGRVVDVVPSADGRIVYVSQEASVRIFDSSTGRSIGRAGQAGSGPGEFALISWIGTQGDTLVVGDWRQSRVSLFSPTGNLYRTENLAPSLAAAASPGTLLRPVGLGAGGSLFVEGRPPSQPSETRRTLSSPIYLLRRSAGISRALVPERSTAAPQIFQRPSGGITVRMAPIVTTDHLAIARNGSSLLYLWTPESEENTSRFWITRFNAEGDTIYRLPYRYSPAAYPEAVADSMRRALGDIADQVPLPARQPPIASVRLNPDGSVWLRRSPTDMVRAHWLVLDEEGQIQAALVLPSRTNILFSDGRVAWGVTTDDLDVPYVVRYRIVR